jgi:dsDNA-specific endonuclease/ATPase MutS2
MGYAGRVLRRLLQVLFGDGARGEARAERGEQAEKDDPIPEAAGDEPVEMPIEDAIDLHTFAPRDVASVVEEYLYEAQARGFREVRVIHGRGKGVQRQVVRGVLSRHPAVASFGDAPATRGGWGATLVWLKEGSIPRD